MKITRRQLRQIIKEELSRSLSERKKKNTPSFNNGTATVEMLDRLPPASSIPQTATVEDVTVHYAGPGMQAKNMQNWSSTK